MIEFKAGKGKEFKSDMEELIALIRQELTEAFSSAEYDEEKERINKRFQAEKDEIIEKLQSLAKEKNFGVRMGNGGVYFMPIIDEMCIRDRSYIIKTFISYAYIVTL